MPPAMYSYEFRKVQQSDGVSHWPAAWHPAFAQPPSVPEARYVVQSVVHVGAVAGGVHETIAPLLDPDAAPLDDPLAAPLLDPDGLPPLDPLAVPPLDPAEPVPGGGVTVAFPP